MWYKGRMEGETDCTNSLGKREGERNSLEYFEFYFSLLKEADVERGRGD